MKVIKKPWGMEIIYAHNNGVYIGKKLFIAKGQRLSLQNHINKHETFYLDKGIAEITISDKIFRVSDLDPHKKRTFIIEPQIRHRIKAITDCFILESSTNHPNDVQRHEDDYGRLKKSNSGYSKN